MWLQILWRRWFGRTRPYPSSLRRRRLARRPRIGLRLEALEDRTLLSAPGVVSLGEVKASGNTEGSVTPGTYFLGGNFDTGNQSVGGITGSGDFQFGAKLNLDLKGKVGFDLGYSASSGGQVNATYQGVNLQQNFVDPTQFFQQVDFTPQNTNVYYTGGKFSTSGLSASVSAALDAKVGGSVGGTIAFFKSYSNSTNFQANIDQPLINVGIGSTNNQLGLTFGLFGQDLSSYLNTLSQTPNLSLKVNPAGPEVPIYIQGDANGSVNPFKLSEDFQVGTGEGEGNQAVGGSVVLGSADEFIPNISLNSNNPQSGGVLTASGQGNIADLNIQMGPIVGTLLSALGVLPGSALLAADQDTISVGPASLIFTPVSFQLGPTLSLAQTGTVTPTNQLTYNFYTDSTEKTVASVDVTENGKPLGSVSSVTFTPGKDNVSLEFAGTPITVQPTWKFGLNYNDELDLDASVQSTLTAGTLALGYGPVTSPTLGPAYQQTFDFADFKLATIYNSTSTLYSYSKPLSAFTIGGDFKPSLRVNTTADGNTTFNTALKTNGTLRGAIDSANYNSTQKGQTGTQTIRLGPGTYNLTIPQNGSNNGSAGGLYVSAANLVIEGAGAGQTIINASSGLGDRVFKIASGAKVTLEGVSIQGGNSTTYGGGIYNAGKLKISDSTITGNSTGTGDLAEELGGGVYNAGTLTIDDSTVTGNTASDGGGGIYNNGTLTIDDSTISDNKVAIGFGGGIVNGVGLLTINDSTISGNSVKGDGGGVVNDQSSTATINNSTIANNTATPITSAIVGGGVYNTGNLTLLNSTISGNKIGFIVGVIGSGTVGGVGAGIYAAPLSFRQNEVTDLENTIVAGNTQSRGSLTPLPSDVYGPLSTTSAYNLIGDGAGLTGITNNSNGNSIGSASAPIDPKLAPLGDYGGPTQTFALLQGSPAIDAGSSSLAANAGLLTDQRGFSRNVGASVDIGAVEYQYDLSLNGSLAAKTALGTAVYNYTVTNNGPDPVAGVTLTIPLPTGTTFQSLTAPTGWADPDLGGGTNGTVTLTDTNSLNSGQSADFSIAVQLPNSTVGSALTNTATVGPAAWDDNSQNNSATLTITNEQEGQAFTGVKLFHFTAASSGATANDFTATVDWGDGGSNKSSDGSGTISVVADANGGFDVLGSHTYAEEGNYAIAVNVAGLDGTTAIGNSQQLFAVADAPLKAGALTPPANATINQPITKAVLFRFTDADPNGTASDYTAKVTWGDGSSNSSDDSSGTVSVVADLGGGFDVIGSHTYTQIVNPGTFTVQVGDAGGSSTSASDSKFQVLYPDQPLTAGALYVPAITTEGQSVGSSLSKQVLFHFSDADHNAQVSDYLATVTWGDGTFNTSADNSHSVAVIVNAKGGFDVVGSHVYGEGSGNYFSVKVTDLGDSTSALPDRGGQSTGAVSSAPLTITDPPVVATAGPTFKANPKTLSSVQTVATFTDPGGPEPNATEPNLSPAPYLATIQWGDGTITVASLTAQANYAAATLTGSYVPVVNAPQVSGSGGSLAAGTYYYTVTSTTATGESTPSKEVSAQTTGGASAVTLSWGQVAGATGYRIYRGTSPGAENTLIAALNDGTAVSFTDTGSETTFAASSQQLIGHQLISATSVPGIVLGSDNKTFAVNLAHQYAAAGAYSITTTILHGDTTSGPVITQAVVGDQVSATGGFSIAGVAGVNTGNQTVATFTDPDGAKPVADYSASINWGDGTSSQPDISNGVITFNATTGVFTVSAAHTYANVGAYPIGVVIENLGVFPVTVTSKATITPAAPMLTVSDAGGIYNGKSFPATATAVGVDHTTPVAGSFAFAYYVGSVATGTSSATAPSSAGTYTVVATFTSSNPNYAGGSVQTTFTIAPATTAFSNLTVQQIILGTNTTTIAGQLASNTIVPAGQNVSITVNGVTQTATVASDGSFSTSFVTGALGVGAYAIDYSYAGNGNLTATSGIGSLTVSYGTKWLSHHRKHIHAGHPLHIKLELTNASGADVSAPNITVTAISLVGPNGKPVTLKSAGDCDENNLFRFERIHGHHHERFGVYTFNLDTRGLTAGTYTLYYKAGNDPIAHSLSFAVESGHWWWSRFPFFF